LDSISNIVSNIVSEAEGKTGEQVTEELDARLNEAGHTPLKVVKTGETESRENANCPSGVEGREEYKVDHGDGTFSDPWWGPWSCY
jgi:hypothetical protein